MIIALCRSILFCKVYIRGVTVPELASMAVLGARGHFRGIAGSASPLRAAAAQYSWGATPFGVCVCGFRRSRPGVPR
jgi:hypothetical protein